MKHRLIRLSASSALSLLALASAGLAQTGVAWVSFHKAPEKLPLSGTVLSDNDTQAFFAVGDLDKDGWEDVVVVRKSQAAQVSPRPAFLLMSVNGVLRDKTAQYASASDVPGDQGFLTPTNCYEAAIGDVNGDTWPDVVTCTALSDGKPKAISHPRVYVNLGDDANGDWLGLRHENARIPQLLTVGGLGVAPRFAGLGFGDVTGDGAPDLYFVDFDTTETGINEPASAELNDRLLVNDGTGFFTDQSSARFTTEQLKSASGRDAQTVDLNDDGLLDIVKDSFAAPPNVVRALYNNPAEVGLFAPMGVSDFGSNAPQGFRIGDLNHDAFVDAVFADDSVDRYRFGTSYNGLNKVVWGPLKPVTFVSGADDGFAHNVYLQDLDNNGWDDVLITDVDVELTGCNRRGHIFHNTGSVPGDLNLVLKEESELASGSIGAGWKGVVGLTAVDLKGSYAFGLADFDKDGDTDMLLATCSGTNYWTNDTITAPEVCQTDLGFGGPGALAFSICGQDLTAAGSTATLAVTGAAPNASLTLALGLTAQATPFHGGFLVPVPVLALVGGLQASGAGAFSMPIAGGANTPVHIIMQVLSKPAATFELSNALDVELGF